MHDEALQFFLVLDGARARHGRGGQIRFRASHPFCSCGFLARMMPQTPFYLLPSPSLQTCELPSAFRTLAALFQQSLLGRNSHLTRCGEIYCRPENDLSVSTVSCNLGGQELSLRDALRSTPCSPRNQPPSSSHSAPVYCVTGHHGSENLSRKKLEVANTLGPLPPALAKSCTH